MLDSEELLDRSILRDSADRLLSDFARRAARRDSIARFPVELWERFAELGWLSLPFAASAGGLQQSLAAAGVVVEAAGYHGVRVPYVSTVLLCGKLIESAGTDGQRQELLPAIMSGSRRFALVHTMGERSRTPPMVLAPCSEGMVLDGMSHAVIDGDADHYLIAVPRADANRSAEDIDVVIVPRSSSGLSVTERSAFGGTTVADLRFESVLVPEEMRLGGGAKRVTPELGAACDSAIVAWGFELLGILRSLVDSTRDFITERRQFGKALGANQVVRHRVVDMHILCEEASALIARACEARGDTALAIRASAVKAAIPDAAQKVAHEAIQLHGAMGVTEDLPLGRHLRRILALKPVLGSPEYHLRRYSAAATRSSTSPRRSRLESGDDGSVDWPDRSTFVRQVDAFLCENLTPELRSTQAGTVSYFADPDVSKEWQRRLANRGWGAPAWPREYGGTGWTAKQQYIFEERCANAGAPPQYPVGLRMIGPTIMRFGSDRQKAKYLPKILSGEDYWCQGFSEPAAGSDLAAIRTRATREGDRYLVSGTKIWTTHAHAANRMFALVRTNDTGRPQSGITLLLIDMDQPGIDIQPITTIDGEQELNQVYLENVLVPIEDRIGDEGQGWAYAKYLLEFERGATLEAPRLRRALFEIEQLAAEERASKSLACEGEDRIDRMISRLGIAIDTLETMELKAITEREAGGSPGTATAAILKVRSTELRQSISELGVSIVGDEVLFGDEVRSAQDGAPAIESHFVESNVVTAGIIARRYLSDRSHTIFGGTSEIQRNILARLLIGP